MLITFCDLLSIAIIYNHGCLTEIVILLYVFVCALTRSEGGHRKSTNKLKFKDTAMLEIHLALFVIFFNHFLQTGHSILSYHNDNFKSTLTHYV